MKMRNSVLWIGGVTIVPLLVGCAKKSAPTSTVRQKPGFIRIVNLSGSDVAVNAGDRSLFLDLKAGQYTLFTTIPAKVNTIQITQTVDYAKVKPGEKPKPVVLGQVQLSNGPGAVESVIYYNKGTYLVPKDIEKPTDTNFKIVALDNGTVKDVNQPLKLGPVTTKPGDETAMVIPGTYTIGGKPVEVKSGSTYLVITNGTGSILQVVDYTPKKPVAAGTAAG